MTDSPRSATTLFRNVRIFNGTDPDLSASSEVLVRGTTIERVAAAGTWAEATPTTVIDGGGRVLMPGLIDAHWHAAFTTLPAAGRADR